MNHNQFYYIAITIRSTVAFAQLPNENLKSKVIQCAHRHQLTFIDQVGELKDTFLLSVPKSQGSAEIIVDALNAEADVTYVALQKPKTRVHRGKDEGWL